MAIKPGRRCRRPPAAILQIISELASNPYDLEENWNDARRTAQDLKEEQIEHLLAAMIHVPPVPTNGDALEWIPRVQLAAEQVIAHLARGGRVRRGAGRSGPFFLVRAIGRPWLRLLLWRI